LLDGAHDRDVVGERVDAHVLVHRVQVEAEHAPWSNSARAQAARNGLPLASAMLTWKSLFRRITDGQSARR
jgi:hypothetical protein